MFLNNLAQLIFFVLLQILGFVCSIGTLLCSFNCGLDTHPPSYDKMQESSTHFTLHETTTTPRAVTTESIPPTFQQQQQSQNSGLKHLKSGGCPTTVAQSAITATVPHNPRHHQVWIISNLESMLWASLQNILII